MESLYPRDAVRPMWEELSHCGVRPLTTVDEVDRTLGEPGTTLLVVNSVCGCAGGIARPGVTRALQHSKIPDRCATVFAGVDREATERARSYMKNVAPSSPAVALFKGGKLVHMLERRHIEQMSEEQMVDSLAGAFDAHCSRPGPSVPAEIYQKVVRARQERLAALYNPFLGG